ncbi:acyl carrier protein [Arthrobacter sp. R1-13]
MNTRSNQEIAEIVKVAAEEIRGEPISSSYSLLEQSFTSISLIRLIARLEELLDVELSLEAVIRKPFLSSISDQVVVMTGRCHE